MLLLPQPRSLEVDPTGHRVIDTPSHEGIDASMAPQSYRLVVADHGVDLTAGDAAGLRHGRATVAQLRHRANAPAGALPGTLPACRIEDRPDFAVRGVMLDVSRDKVPSLDTMAALVDRLASWKVNQLQLYTEHTFAYSGHDEVWAEADPYTAEDMDFISSRCAPHGIELVANQNTLGHFERWLRHDRYRPLAIAPDGFEWLFGIRRRPTTLDPAHPGAWELVRDLLNQLVGVVGSSRVHVGMDEPWELGADRLAEWAGWLTRIRDLPALGGREVLVWGDIPAQREELLAGVPEGVTVCEWGYEDTHPFDERLARLAEAGVPRWVCPGTSSWLSVSGRVENMMGNIRAAARAGVAHGCDGLLVTDWGDMGHHQYLPVSEAGLATAAAMGWCASAHEGLDVDGLARALDAHGFDDPAGHTGAALAALGRVHRMVAPRPPNISPLVTHVLLPQWPVGVGPSAGLAAADLDKVEGAIDDAEAALGLARPQRADGKLVTEELAATGVLLRLACRDARLRLAGDGTLASVAAPDRAALAATLRGIIEEHRRLWLARNRPGGLGDSVAWFSHLQGCYETGHADGAWFGPLG